MSPLSSQEGDLSFPTLCSGRPCLAWPGCPLRVQTWGWLLRAGLRAWHRSQRSQNRQERVSSGLPFSLTCLAADFSMPGAPGHVSNLETASRHPHPSSAPLVASHPWVKEVWMCPGLKGPPQCFSLPCYSLPPLTHTLCIFIEASWPQVPTRLDQNKHIRHRKKTNKTQKS